MLAEECKKLCDTGVCKNICCGAVPFDIEIYRKYAYTQGRRKFKEVAMRDKDGKDYILLKTKDLTCTFLDCDNKCAIYEDRPSVCRQFGDESHELLKCPYLSKKGVRRSKAETDKLLGITKGGSE